jgi:hypothetical protein
MKILSCLCAALAMPTFALAQADSAHADSTQAEPAAAAAAPAAAMPAGPVTVVNYTFNNPGEFVRVQLQAGVTYVAELNTPGVSLTLKPRNSGVQKPDVRKDMMGPSASGGSSFLIKPFADAEYEFRCTGARSGAAVTLTVRTRP